MGSSVSVCVVRVPAEASAVNVVLPTVTEPGRVNVTVPPDSRTLSSVMPRVTRGLSCEDAPGRTVITSVPLLYPERAEPLWVNSPVTVPLISIGTVKSDATA